jgi:hypothetical protein
MALDQHDPDTRPLRAADAGTEVRLGEGKRQEHQGRVGAARPHQRDDYAACLLSRAAG